MDYTSIYEEWDGLPDCRIRIALYDEGGERVWGKVLPDGTFGINNLPLHEEYRYQDIVVPSISLGDLVIRDSKALRHRRWKQKVVYGWNEPADEDTGKSIRQKILDLADEQGFYASFWSPGWGSIMLQEDVTFEEATTRAASLLESLGIKITKFC